MSEWTGIVAVLLTFLTLLAGVLRFYIKAILREFSPNSGNSLRDRIDIIEARQMDIQTLIFAHAKDHG